jgi:ATP-dependent helicase/nuclease subunit B
LTDRDVLQGRIDRIDRENQNLHVMDYKTGSTISPKNQVESGEQVQLLCYASLLRNIDQVAYIDLYSESSVQLKSKLNREKLANLEPDNLNRLQEIIRELHDGATLPAWADDSVCTYCEYQGLCRKSHWKNSHLEEPASVEQK